MRYFMRVAWYHPKKERDFVKSGYDDIKRVYSIWICMNMEQNSMNHIHFVNDAVIGNHEWKGKIDLINIIMIGIAKRTSGTG